jgi:dipeptidyl aminopeptidase/acylaminoacyl peptidase
VAFSKLSQADPAGKEFDDLVDAVDYLVKIRLVDKKRVGITGGSYGGYASAWGATYYSHRYAASVMFVGISDQFLSFALGDIPEEHRLVHHMKYPWEDMELIRQRSPISHFQKCRTPLLILHGKTDTRVHPAQSLALYRAIKTYGKTPVRLVRYPGEGHGNRRTGFRLDFSLRLMRWMHHYLKGPGGDPPPYVLDLSGIKTDEAKDIK